MTAVCGGIVVVHGMDDMITGGGTLLTGVPRPTATNRLLETVTGSQKMADVTEAAVTAIASIGLTALMAAKLGWCFPAHTLVATERGLKPYPRKSKATFSNWPFRRPSLQ